jgi:3-hydroxybutyryl-CoA dehydrogenase
MNIQSVYVIGAGTMGHGIAQVCAVNGYEVRLNDISGDLIEKGLGGIGKGLDRMVKKEKISLAQKVEILGHITPSLNIEECAECDLVIEAATEKLDIKKMIFEKIDSAAKPGAILATNTSSLSVTDIASATVRPQDVIGLHFFNPVPVMRLIEIVRAMQTSDECAEAIRQFAITIGKEPVLVKDYPGFISNRVLMIMINEAIFSLYEGVAEARDIDTVMKLGMNHPMGPLELADMIGLDICLHVMERLFTGFGDPKFRPCPLLVNMVAAKKFGKKTGEGFYRYDK